ncbi:hypothetical protein IJ818_07490 [bacterium]|nr:hypothetical protein [bacterium]
MNKLSKEELSSYINTFAITFFIVTVIVGIIMGITWVMIPNSIKNPKIAKTTDELDYYLIDFLIEKNQYLLSKYPKNYGYNIRLGTLYAIKKDYINSERELLIAVEKSPYMAYRARYKLATLYIKMNKLAEAQKLMDEITDKPDKKLIKNKGLIYKEIGNKLFEQEYYPQAASKYEKAIFYLKRCDKKELEDTKIKLSDCYEAIADVFVEKGMIEEGTYYLEKADALNDKPQINYKLALLYMDTDPNKSFELLEVVRKEAPEMLDYYMYYNLLMEISESAAELGDKAAKDLYAMKAKRFQDYVSSTILYKNDVIVNISDINVSYNKQNKELDVDVKFQLRNNSPFNIKNLTAQLVFKEKGHKIRTFNKQIFAYENIFPIGEQTSTIRLSTELDERNLNINEDSLNVDFYLFKKENHKLLVKEFQIKKPVELLKK